jgi:hypothetical protein
MNIRHIIFSVCASTLPFSLACAQPAPIPTGANTLCNATAGTDTVVANPDSAGFRPIFNGKNLQGWWENCLSGHSSADRNNGGIWLVDTARGLLFSNQNTNSAGGILMTNKTFGNYELIFDYWPSFGDDGGVFNRTTTTGTCYQTTLDYIQGSGIGGVYFEANYANTTRNLDPFLFGANRYTVTVGTGAGNWTSITQGLANSPCPSTGCTPANWTTVFDTGGWNQVRVKFFGTGASATNKVHNQSWIRKLGAATWVPVVQDSMQYNTPANFLGFQIHGGTGSWSNRNGVWYRNIILRPLTDLGVPIPQVTTSVAQGSRSGYNVNHYDIHATADALTGSLDRDHEITVSDLSGKVLEKFSGRAGAFRHVLATRTQGVLLLQVKTDQRTECLKVSRI